MFAVLGEEHLVMGPIDPTPNDIAGAESLRESETHGSDSAVVGVVGYATPRPTDKAVVATETGVRDPNRRSPNQTMRVKDRNLWQTC